MALRPDVIVTQSQCEVCAVSARDLDEALAQWMGGTSPAVVSLTAASLDGVFGDIARAAAALGADRAGARVIGTMKERIERIAARAASAASRPKVATIEWID